MASLSVREDGVEISPISYKVGKLNADKRSQLFVSCFLLLPAGHVGTQDATAAKRMHE